MSAAAPRVTIVKVAEWAAARADGVIVTLGLGSCVAIMLHDPQAHAGAMAHVLLPSKSLARDATNPAKFPETAVRSEEHTSELQSPCNLVCRLLLEKKKKHNTPASSLQRQHTRYARGINRQ